MSSFFALLSRRGNTIVEFNISTYIFINGTDTNNHCYDYSIFYYPKKIKNFTSLSAFTLAHINKLSQVFSFKVSYPAICLTHSALSLAVNIISIMFKNTSYMIRICWVVNVNQSVGQKKNAIPGFSDTRFVISNDKLKLNLLILFSQLAHSSIVCCSVSSRQRMCKHCRSGILIVRNKQFQKHQYPVNT